jgi:hypothetical protein
MQDHVFSPETGVFELNGQPVRLPAVKDLALDPDGPFYKSDAGL